MLVCHISFRGFCKSIEKCHFPVATEYLHVNVFRWDSYQTWEVYGRFNYAQWSYINFRFHYTTLAFPVPPQPCPSTKMYNLDDAVSSSRLYMSHAFSRHVWGRSVHPARRSTSLLKKLNFLLPAWGAMTVTGYWQVHVFRPGLQPNVRNLVQFQPYGVDLQQRLVSRWTTDICWPTTANSWTATDNKNWSFDNF